MIELFSAPFASIFEAVKFHSVPRYIPIVMAAIRTDGGFSHKAIMFIRHRSPYFQGRIIRAAKTIIIPATPIPIVIEKAAIKYSIIIFLSPPLPDPASNLPAAVSLHR